MRLEAIFTIQAGADTINAAVAGGAWVPVTVPAGSYSWTEFGEAFATAFGAALEAITVERYGVELVASSELAGTPRYSLPSGSRLQLDPATATLDPLILGYRSTDTADDAGGVLVPPLVHRYGWVPGRETRAQLVELELDGSWVDPTSLGAPPGHLWGNHERMRAEWDCIPATRVRREAVQWNRDRDQETTRPAPETWEAFVADVVMGGLTWRFYPYGTSQWVEAIFPHDSEVRRVPTAPPLQLQSIQKEVWVVIAEGQLESPWPIEKANEGPTLPDTGSPGDTFTITPTGVEYTWSAVWDWWIRTAWYGAESLDARIHGDVVPSAETPAWTDRADGSTTITADGERVTWDSRPNDIDTTNSQYNHPHSGLTHLMAFYSGVEEIVGNREAAEVEVRTGVWRTGIAASEGSGNWEVLFPQVDTGQSWDVQRFIEVVVTATRIRVYFDHATTPAVDEALVVANAVSRYIAGDIRTNARGAMSLGRGRFGVLDDQLPPTGSPGDTWTHPVTGVEYTWSAAWNWWIRTEWLGRETLNATLEGDILPSAESPAWSESKGGAGAIYVETRDSLEYVTWDQPANADSAYSGNVTVTPGNNILTAYVEVSVFQTHQDSCVFEVRNGTYRLGIHVRPASSTWMFMSGKDTGVPAVTTFPVYLEMVADGPTVSLYHNHSKDPVATEDLANFPAHAQTQWLIGGYTPLGRAVQSVRKGRFGVLS